MDLVWDEYVWAPPASWIRPVVKDEEPREERLARMRRRGEPRLPKGPPR